MFSFSLLELVQKTVEITHNKHIPTVSRLEEIQNSTKLSDNQYHNLEDKSFNT